MQIERLVKVTYQGAARDRGRNLVSTVVSSQDSEYDDSRPGERRCSRYVCISLRIAAWTGWLQHIRPCVGDSVRNIDDDGGCLSFASCTWRAGSHTEPNRPRHSDCRDGVACHDIRGAGRAGNVARENQLARR